MSDIADELDELRGDVAKYQDKVPAADKNLLEEIKLWTGRVQTFYEENSGLVRELSQGDQDSLNYLGESLGVDVDNETRKLANNSPRHRIAANDLFKPEYYKLLGQGYIIFNEIMNYVPDEHKSDRLHLPKTG